MTGCQHERQLITVYWMHLAIINDNSHIAGIAACQRTVLDTVHNTLEDSRHETCINGTTYHRVEEYQLTTPLQ